MASDPRSRVRHRRAAERASVSDMLKPRLAGRQTVVRPLPELLAEHFEIPPTQLCTTSERASNRACRAHRSAIEPFIIDPLQSPLECWRIQVTISSNHVDGSVLVLAARQDRQLGACGRVRPHHGAIHLSAGACLFIQVVMSAHQLSLLMAVAGVIIIQLLPARLTLAPCTPLKGCVEELSSRFAAIAMPMPVPAARSATAATARPAPNVPRFVELRVCGSMDLA